MAEQPTPAHREYITVPLPNHRRQDYADILDALPGDMPIPWTYTVPAATDVDPAMAMDQARGVESRGIKAEALIDFAGDHAEVHLPVNAYADTPADDLAPEAERVLTAWVADRRSRVDIQSGKIDEQA